MNVTRHRKIEARERRQESLRNRGITVETTVQLPQPKNLVKKEIVNVESIVKGAIKKNDLPKVTEIVKRGRGRPPKAISEKINTSKKALVGKITTKGKGKK